MRKIAKNWEIFSDFICCRKKSKKWFQDTFCQQNIMDDGYKYCYLGRLF